MSPSTEQMLPGGGSDDAAAVPDDAPLAELRARLADLALRDEERLRRRVDRLRARPDTLQRVAEEIAEAQARIATRRASVPAVSYPPQLPVSARRDDLLATIRDHQVVVVAGETGSGKTTQLPKICLELGRGVRGAIAHTQPRRIAARTVAERIAEELGVELGEAVGYAVRFSDRTSDATLVRLVTDGLLLAEIQRDPLLRRYDTIIVDEAHERSLNIDFLLGCVKRILPLRPDLKLIITSATIDPERFSRHFGDAPIVEVSGRTYPVEVRYRPLAAAEGEEERDQADAIGDAVAELQRAARGDVLVFLSGEREIRDTADALSGRFGTRLDILPLYARLATAEQQKVFRPHTRPRVVLATNVAETSLTVPGIRYVVDPGTARISRYSARLKVQRLPIEEVSQASADQRKGRSGRQSDGIAIRLYSEEDFTARPRFTDPEILRTNLASVILQMAALGLGEIEDFPFLDPPDRRQIRDGVLLLQELGALDPDAEDPARRLTPLGRRLAQLPVDPRFGRMVLEADRLGCVEEVVVIAAALSIQDPRERPTEQRAQADQLHGRFRDEHSDFIAFLNLWTYLQEQQRELSGSQFRKRLRGEFLHYLRVREWQDLVGQLRASARAIGLTLRHEPAEPGTADDVRSHVHIAMLAGLLSHVGVKDERRRGEYLGARGARFAIFPGSVLARRAPAWVMAAELVETTRLWGRTAARIEPAWVEPLAGHLVRRTYDEPHWERKRASAVALERVTLYGLPIVAGRKVAYGAIDPVLSRELFIRRGLVEGDWETRHHFFHDNRRLLAEVEALEDRVRRRDILVDDGTLFDFYDARIPAEIVSGAHFDRWWRKERRRDPERLSFTQELLVNADAADAVDPAAWPERWRDGELSLPLSYRFEPGTPEDGVTVHVPLPALAGLEAASFAWLVPGLRRELVTALVRALPKELRRPLVPVPEVVTQVLERIRPGEPLFDAVARSLRELRGVRVPEGAWDGIVLPPHLRTRFSIEDGNGDALAVGADLDALREAVRPRLRAELAAAAGPSLERSGLTAWTIGTLPREVELPGAGGLARAYPSLVDEGATVGVRMLDTPEAQAGGMHAGTRRLLRLTVPSPSRAAERGLSNAEKLTLAGAPHGSAAAALDDATTAALDALILAAGGPAWDEQGWSVLHDYVARELGGTVAKVVAWLVRILDAAREVQLALDRLPAEPAFQPARLDVARQLGRLTFPGFVAAAGVARLPDVERYLRGAARRIDQLPRGLAADRDRTRTIEELEAAHRFQLAAMPAGAALPAPLREVPWALEELRVSYFAQGLGVRGSASPKQVRKLLAEAARGAQPTG